MNTFTITTSTVTLGLAASLEVQSSNLILRVDSYPATELLLLGMGGGVAELPQSGQIWPLGLA